MKNRIQSIITVTAIPVMFAAGICQSEAAITAQWTFDEELSDLTNNNNGTWNGVVEATGTYTSQIWSSNGSTADPTGLVANAGYYDFDASTNPHYAVNTGTTSLLPQTGDFTVSATVRIDGVPAGNEYILSNNNSQQGRFDFGFLGGDLFVFINGDLNAQANVFLDADVSGLVFDNEWHTVGISRDSTSGEIHLLVDGNSVGSTVGSAQISTSQLFTIGRQRGSLSNNYLGDMANLQVENVAVPEPGTVGLLAGLSALLAAVMIRRRR